MRKAARWIEECLSTGRVSQRKLRKYNFACAPPEFENLLSQYQLYMDNENYLKEGTRQFYLSSVRTFFRTMGILGIYRYAEITLADVTRCLAKISETFPCGIFNLTGSMRSFARFMAEKHPELLDISPALVFSAAKRRRVYVGYTHEDAQKIFSAINRSSTMGMRDYAMIMLAYTTGLRGCDIVNLKFNSIDWDACELRLVQEKTNIPVSLPLDTTTGNAIADYILNARPKCDSEYVFLRTQRPYTKLRSMWTVIAKYARIALGKSRRMNGPHAFRRGMGETATGSRYSRTLNLQYSGAYIVYVFAPIYRVILREIKSVRRYYFCNPHCAGGFVMMRYPLKSSFAEQIRSFVDYKNSLGFPYDESCRILWKFDNFCAEIFPKKDSLDRELALAWLEKRDTENTAGHRNRIMVIREFAKYLRAVGTEAYMIPISMTSKGPRYVPHIFNEAEIKAFFHGADSFRPHEKAPARHLVMKGKMPMKYPNKDYIEHLHRKYPPGTRLQLSCMEDEFPVPPGSMGTVECIDDAGQIHVDWDCGRSLAPHPRRGLVQPLALAQRKRPVMPDELRL